MRRIGWQTWLGLALIILSAVAYLIHYFIFRDLHHILIYLVSDIAFVFIEVLLVTLIIHQLLASREKRAMLEKMNMVIGAFYSDVGTKLLMSFAKFDPHIEKIRDELATAKTLSNRDFDTLSRKLDSYDTVIISGLNELNVFADFLYSKLIFWCACWRIQYYWSMVRLRIFCGQLFTSLMSSRGVKTSWRYPRSTTSTLMVTQGGHSFYS